MKKLFFLLFSLCVTAHIGAKTELWPNGSPIDKWFTDVKKVDVAALGRQYVITDYGVVNDSTIIQTQHIQAVIDRVAQEGGGVVVVPEGTFLSGALMATDCNIGRNSGFVADGIRNVLIRMHSVRG